MSVLKQLPRWLVWELVIPLSFLNIWLVSKVFQVFETPLSLLITSTLLSFLLSYPVRQLQKRGLSKNVSVLLILLSGVTLVLVLGVLGTPLLFQQLEDLGDQFPDWLSSTSQQFQTLDTWLSDRQLPLDITALVDQVTQLLPNELLQLPDQTLDAIQGLADRLVEALLTGVLTIYLLLHGDQFWQGLWGWFPEAYATPVRSAFQDQFRNYFVGQATIALVMTIILTPLFFCFAIPYWLVFGLGIGLLTLIPLGDVVGILIATVVVSFKSILLGGEILALAVITDQIVDNAIAPRILGRLVGLNPIWILISLLLGGQLGGFLGLILAIPLAGSLKSIATHFRTLHQTQFTTSQPISTASSPIESHNPFT
ncbi:AI-2E family transporter [Prochlorothrix hollandica]|uniref:AI-2E family transporter n=1 Tax=Prochlorothrix hollandica TaxID=1223 RepID=UPI00034A50BF|nr:AI-2E family transporter [Prochlorothrix hollandica]